MLVVHDAGAGNFGGARQPAGPSTTLPDRSPDHTVRCLTSPVQTLLYRHGGNDANRLHVDPTFARRAGFRAPILTGQNMLGIATHAIVTAVLGHPHRLMSIGGRFVNAGYNGDELCTEIWSGTGGPAGEDGAVWFRVLNQHGEVLVDRGSATHR